MKLGQLSETASHYLKVTFYIFLYTNIYEHVISGDRQFMICWFGYFLFNILLGLISDIIPDLSPRQANYKYNEKIISL